MAEYCADKTLGGTPSVGACLDVLHVWRWEFIQQAAVSLGILRSQDT